MAILGVIGTGELTSDLRTTEGQLDVWLLQGSERFAADREVSDVLIKLAREKDTRCCILLLGEILNPPGLADRLFDALRPATLAPATRRLSREPAQSLSKGRHALAAAEEKPRRRT